MSSTLYDALIRICNGMALYTTNETIKAFNVETCKLLDDESSKDSFIDNRVKKAITELDKVKGIDYDSHCRTAYESYNEALTYLAIRKKYGKIRNIPEQSSATPDFEIMINCSFERGVDDMQPAYLEVKTLGFAEGNNLYKQCQQDALDCNIELEAQRREGKRVCSAVRVVAPLGHVGFVGEIEEILKKVGNNVKKEQFEYGNGEVVLYVDLNQLTFSNDIEMSCCLPVYPDLKRKCVQIGRYWTLAFGRIGDRIYKQPEFEGRGNFDKDLNADGVLISYPYVKGVIFGTGSKIENKRFYGFYRAKDSESNAALLIEAICDFCNDDINSNGYMHFEKLNKTLNQ